MSITSQTARSGPFLITSLPQVIAVGFPFQQGSDLEVLDAGAVGTGRLPPDVLTLGSDYTVSGGGYNNANEMQTGSITVLSTGTNSVLAGDYIFIQRNVPINQTTSFVSTGPLTMPLVEQALDKQATISQELAEQIAETVLPGDVTNSTVTADGTTTARRLGARFAEVYNVKDFGAVGDSTTNDTTAIQLALNTGKCVYFPPLANGNYYKVVGIPLVIGDDQMIFGDGFESYVRQTTVGVNLFEAVTKSYIEIHSLRLYGYGDRLDATHSNCLYASQCSFLTVSDCYLVNPGVACVLLEDCADCEIRGNTTLPGSGTAPIQASDIFVKGACSRIIVADNTCRSNGHNAITVHTWTSGSTTSKDHVISNNTVYNYDRQGIVLYRYSASDVLQSCLVIGNTVDTVTGAASDDGGATFPFGQGIYLQGAEYCTVVGNPVRNCSASSVPGSLPVAGIVTANLSTCIIEANPVTGNTQNGIYISDVNQAGIGSGSGSPNFEPYGGITIKGNQCYSNGNNQIRVEDHHNVTVEGNQTFGGSIGIVIAPTDTVNYPSLKRIKVIGNTVRLPSGAGITLTRCTEADVIGNTSSINATDYALAMVNPIRCFIGYNILDNASGGAGYALRLNGTPGTHIGNRVDKNRLTATNSLESNITVVWGDNDLTGSLAFATYGPTSALANSATPSVQDGGLFTNGNTTAITNFSLGVLTQKITIRAGASFKVTSVPGTINLQGAADFNMVSGNILVLQQILTGQWDEISRKT